MSFTLTNQSLIRLESSKDDDEWNRTLMFFNVDISSGVCRDHQNKISQPRSSVCNGKRELINDIWQSSANPNIYANLGRAPGGGLANPITESVMSFVAANKFYAREHSNFDHGNYTPRTSGRRRDNFAYSDRRRHFYHRPIKSGRSRAAIGLVSPSPSADSTGYYESKRIHYPDFETGKTFDNFYPDDEPYELEEDEPRRVLSTSDYTKQQEDPRANKEYADGRYDYYPHGSRSTNRHHRESKRYNRYPFPEHPAQDDYHRDFRRAVPRQLRSSSYRMKHNCRQASGSLPPNYASNCYPHDSTEYGCDNDYDGYPENYKKYRDYYEEPTAEAHQNPYEEFHDYEYPDYKHSSKAPPVPFPKPQPKYYKSYSKSMSPNYPTKIFESEMESKVNGVKVSPYEEAETRQVKSNRIKQNNHSEEIPRRKGFNYVKKRREEPIKYDKISKDISRLAPHVQYASKGQNDRFTIEGNSHRERSVSSTHRKIFSEELPHRYRPKKVINETREPHRNLKTKSVGQYDKSNAEYESYKTRGHHHKSSPDRKKSVDFVRFTDLNDGSEIPHKIRENGQSPSSIFFTIEIPYKKKHRRYTYPQTGEYISKRSHSGCDNFSQKSFRPQTSLYDVGKLRKRKTMKQKISGFFKRSKLCLSKSNIFRSKSKIMKKPAQRNLNCAQISNPSPDYSVNSPIASNHSLESENVEVPSQESEHQKYGLKRGKECHYPTVYRGTNKQLPENNNEIFHQYSMFNVLSSTNQRSKVNNDDYDHFDPGLSKRTSRYFRPTADSPTKSSYKEFDRVSSGNCSLFSEGKSGDAIGKSEINVCLTIRTTDVSLTGSPRIVSSKIVRDRGLSSKSNNGEAKLTRSRPAIRSVSRQSSGSTIFESASGENQFKNVRFSPSHFTHNSCSSAQSSSESNSSRIQTSINSQEHVCKRKSIEASSKPPEMPGSIGSSSEHLRPRHRLVTKWSLTSQSKPYNSRPEPSHCWTPDKLDTNSLRPTLFQSDVTKRSSLKRVDDNLVKSVPKRVVLKTKSSESMISGSMCSSDSSAKSLSTFEIQDKKNDDRSECYRSQSHHFQFGEDRKIEVFPRKTSSWPRQSPRSFPGPPIRNIDPEPFGKSTLSPNTSTQSLESSISRCSSDGLSGNNEGSTSHKPKNMQLVCYPDDDSNLRNSQQSQVEYGSGFTTMRGLDITESSNRGDLCCPKLVSDLERESFCPKSIVEELKRELLQTFRAEQQIRSQSPFLRPTPHIMIFPCVPSVMCQTRANINPSPNLYPRPESEICWIPSSKPQNLA